MLRGSGEPATPATPEGGAGGLAVEASAPGKLVVSGEYAVLAGAPALVAAVDRRVTCTLVRRDAGDWRFVSTGFETQQTLTRDAVFQASADSVAGVVRRVIAEDRAPRNIEVRVDSTPCHWHGAKLGVGSSAALVAAVAAAFSVIGGDAPGLATLVAIHKAFQGGGSGSGLDVAAAVTGGVIRFQDQRIVPSRLPDVHKAFVFVGTPTRTAELVARFDAWRGAASPAALERLIEAAVEVADCTVNADVFLDALSEYTDVLERMDRMARIGIFGPGHQAAREIAARCRVVYKPCGAGGGDTGVGFAANRDAVARFAKEAGDAGLTIVPMEVSDDGIRIRTE